MDSRTNTNIQQAVLDELRTYEPFNCADILTMKINQVTKFINRSRSIIDHIKVSDPIANDQLEKISTVVRSLPLSKEVLDETILLIKETRLLVNAEAGDQLEFISRSIQKLPSKKEIFDIIHVMVWRVESVSTLAEKFIEEMRYNAYNVPKGDRRKAYAVDCCNFIDSCTSASSFLYDSGESCSIEGYEIYRLGTILQNLSRQFKFGMVIRTFEEYYPGTVTINREDEERHNELIEAQGNMSKSEFLEYLDQQELKEQSLTNIEPVGLDISSKITRKEKNITLKQQMILLDMLRFLSADVWGNVATKDKAVILSQLLNRSEQEVRSMLTYWEGKKRHSKYDCTGADDNDVVTDLVLGKGLDI